jgi:hypothetical protein
MTMQGSNCAGAALSWPERRCHRPTYARHIAIHGKPSPATARLSETVRCARCLSHSPHLVFQILLQVVHSSRRVLNTHTAAFNMSDSAVNPYASDGSNSGTAAPTSDENVPAKPNPVEGFFKSAVSKETWSKIGESTADAAKKVGHATSKTAKHLTKGATWVDKEKARASMRWRPAANAPSSSLQQRCRCRVAVGCWSWVADCVSCAGVAVRAYARARVLPGVVASVANQPQQLM